MLSRVKTGGNCPAAGRFQAFSVSDRAVGRGIAPGSSPWKQLGLRVGRISCVFSMSDHRYGFIGARICPQRGEFKLFPFSRSVVGRGITLGSESGRSWALGPGTSISPEVGLGEPARPLNHPDSIRSVEFGQNRKPQALRTMRSRWARGRPPV